VSSKSAGAAGAINSGDQLQRHVKQATRELELFLLELASMSSPAPEHSPEVLEYVPIECFTPLEAAPEEERRLGRVLGASLVPRSFLATAALKATAEPLEDRQQDHERSENR